jgi:hypothetical protein
MAALAGVSACTAGSTAPTPGPTSEPTPGADETARRAAAASEQWLALLAGAVATNSVAQQAATAVARAAAAAHDAHSRALLEGLPPAPSRSPTAGSTIPSILKEAAAALIRAQTAAGRSNQDSLHLVSGPTARLLASVAASDLAYAAALRPVTAHLPTR